MQKIATENNLAETAFLVPQNHDYRPRWFTPPVKVLPCGHATLASEAVVMEPRDRANQGSLSYLKRAAYGGEGGNRLPDGFSGAAVVEAAVNAFNYLALIGSPQAVRALARYMAAIARLDRPGVMVTTPGERGYDFISRYFAPAKGIPEPGNRCGALHAGALLGKIRVQCVSGVTRRLRGPMPPKRRAR